jgi:hypothetical protein
MIITQETHRQQEHQCQHAAAAGAVGYCYVLLHSAAARVGCSFTRRVVARVVADGFSMRPLALQHYVALEFLKGAVRCQTPAERLAVPSTNRRRVLIVDPVCHCPMHMPIARVGCIAGNTAAVPIDAVAVHSARKMSARPVGLLVVSFPQHQRTLEILEGAVTGYVFEPVGGATRNKRVRE